MSKPFFSIVLPTRNRAKLLLRAIQSVLNQTFDDFEIIISDNFSIDDTAQIAQNLTDKRIRYFRSKTALSMGDSFEFALSHARGEFVTFLSDDDAYSKVYLETMYRQINKENAEIVTCRIAKYYEIEDSQFGRNINKSVVIYPFDRKIYTFNRKEALEFLFAKFRLLTPIPEINSIGFPQLVNSVYHSSIIKKVKTQVSKIFPIVSSDIYSSVLFLNAIEKYQYINEPLYLHTVWQGSETSGDKSIYESYPEEMILNYVPLKKFISGTNYQTNAILRAKCDLGETLKKYLLIGKLILSRVIKKSFT
ncbi:MAG: glycosyltransferase family 2 protein [Acidobacteria bacterium]|jgi:glycosyltransferase involved in cell wall biosynthesis|nr:glycosyltransferase family 2 protein [Acidobacteriota bacterium]